MLIAVYGLINYLITGSSADSVMHFVIINTITIVCDYLFVCCIFKNIYRIYFYYGLMYELLYIFSVNFIIHLVEFINGFNRL